MYDKNGQFLWTHWRISLEIYGVLPLMWQLWNWWSQVFTKILEVGVVFRHRLIFWFSIFWFIFCLSYLFWPVYNLPWLFTAQNRFDSNHNIFAPFNTTPILRSSWFPSRSDIPTFYTTQTIWKEEKFDPSELQFRGGATMHCIYFLFFFDEWILKNF